MIEEKGVAIQINDLMHEFCEKINESIIVVQKNCKEEDFVKYRKAAATIMAEVFFEILKPIYIRHPDLKPEGLKLNYGDGG